MSATMISVSAQVVPFEGEELFFSGLDATPEVVRVRANDETGCFDITRPNGQVLSWPYADIRLLEDQAADDQMILLDIAMPEARLIVRDEEDFRVIRGRAKQLHRPIRRVNRKRLALWALAAVASVVLILFVIIPAVSSQLAGMIPYDARYRLGQLVEEQVRAESLPITGEETPYCTGDEGLVALGKMGEALNNAVEGGVSAQLVVLDDPLINAFALPGDQLIFFRGLIDSVETESELMAVFAHELGHVYYRHPTESVLRSAGSVGILGLLVGDFAGGGAVLAATNLAIAADYSREDEAEADQFAFDVMLRAGTSPDGLASFFGRFEDDSATPAIIQHFSTHPLIEERIAEAEAAVPAGFVAQQILTDEEWAALKAVCD